MKKIILSIITILALHNLAQAQDVYVSKNGVISFFSKTPIEDIDATANTAVSAINIKTNAIYFNVKINQFKFKKKLMQEHFNENYLESDKYPNAEFSGTLSTPIDINKNGTYTTDVSGKLTIHGVTKEYTTKATIIVKDKNFVGQAKFDVLLADHKIKIPSVVTKQIAEKINITITSAYQPK